MSKGEKAEAESVVEAKPVKVNQLKVLYFEYIARERVVIREALDSCDWYLMRAAKKLGVLHGSLQATLKRRHPELWEKYSLQAKPGRPWNR